MDAELLYRERLVIADDCFIEIIVWRLPLPLKGSIHRFKYRLALIVAGTCVLRYNNEAGKGDHRHWADTEQPYDFTTPQQLLADFWRDVKDWRD